MSEIPSADRWGVCASCGEIVLQSADPQVERLYHAPTCRDRELPVPMRQLSELPAEMTLLAAPDATVVTRPQPPRPVARLVSPRSHVRKTTLALLAAAGVTAIALAAVAATGRPPATSVPPAAGPRPATAMSGAPSPASSLSPAVVPSNKLARTMPAVTPSPEPAPAPQLPSAASVLVTFSDGTDGWSPFWGSITDTPVTSPAVDGAALLLTTSSDSYSAVGTTTDVAQLTSGDSVEYHVWSSGGGSGSVRPFIQDDSFTIIFAGNTNTALPSSSGWFTLTWTVPATSSVKGIGLQVINPDPGSSTVTLAIGALSWP